MRFVSLRRLRVAVALSGGVDSAVAAILLKSRGHEVIGVHSRNWDMKDENGICTADIDFESAKSVADRLKIDLIEIDCVKEYWTDVFEPFLGSTQEGNSFSTDQLCNSRIKFDAMYKKAKTIFEFDEFATGHYANLTLLEKGNAIITTAADSLKDQTFYLSQLTPPQMKNVCFPLGNLNKNVVKSIAVENGLEHLATKKESMGVCFIGKRKMSDFLSDYLFDPFSKNIIDIDTGKILGKREFPIYGVAVGQRTKFLTNERNHRKKPIAVVDKSSSGNVLVCSGTNHPALFTNNFTLTGLSFAVENPPKISSNDVLSVYVRLYHRSPVIPAVIRKIDEFTFLWMEKPVGNLTRGHPVAIYVRHGQFGLEWEISDDPTEELALLGGGCIHSSGISLWEMQHFKLQPFRKHPFWADMLHRKDYQVGVPHRNLSIAYALGYRDHVDYIKRHRP